MQAEFWDSQWTPNTTAIQNPNIQCLSVETEHLLHTVALTYSVSTKVKLVQIYFSAIMISQTFTLLKNLSNFTMPLPFCFFKFPEEDKFTFSLRNIFWVFFGITKSPPLPLFGLELLLSNTKVVWTQHCHFVLANLLAQMATMWLIARLQI